MVDADMQKPEQKKSITANFVAQLLKERKSICLVFGLGKKGLPKKIFDIGKKHDYFDELKNKYPKFTIEYCLKQKSIDFWIMSLREDLTNDIVEKYIDENWNWWALSTNPNINFDELKHKYPDKCNLKIL